MKDAFKGLGLNLSATNGRLIVSGRERLVKPSLQTVLNPEVAGLEMVQINPFVKAVDVRPLLERHHPFWRGELLEVARQASEIVVVGGSLATSLAQNDYNTYYQPTNGNVIAEHLPWLHRLFETDFQYLVQKAAGDPTLRLGKDLAHSLNINYLKEGGYELHTDRNKETALLALETMEEGEGGLLNVYERLDPLTNRPAGRCFAVRPVAGILYIFNGRVHPHEVTQLRRRKPRAVSLGDYYNDRVKEVIDLAFNQELGLLGASNK